MLMTQEAMALAAALGAGLLVGVERERRKGEGDDRHAAGLRTFVVAAMAGCLAQLVSPWMAMLAVAGVAALAGLSYLRSRSRDPGLTTELALVVTGLIGVLSVENAPLAAASAVILTGVLAARERLHHFATQVLSPRELHDGIVLAGLALVLMPLLPTLAVDWLGGLSAQRVLSLVVVILLMQAAGHVAQRALGARAGLPLSGLLGGFVSSTATISAMGSRARGGDLPWRLCLAAGLMSTVATWCQMGVMASVLSPGLLGQLLPFLAVGVSVPLVAGLALWGVAAAGGAVASAQGGGGEVLRLREALMVGALLVGAAALVNASARFGLGGLLSGTAVAALADAHAPMASLMALFQSGGIDAPTLQQGLLVALAANGLTRTVVAGLSGGWAYGASIGAVLLLNLGVVLGWVMSG